MIIGIGDHDILEFPYILQLILTMISTYTTQSQESVSLADKLNGVTQGVL